jgi:hypothetical protein
MEREAVVETQSREIDEVRNVHRCHVREELDLELALRRIHQRVVGVLRIERDLLGLRQLRAPARVGLVDGGLGDLLVDGLDGGILLFAGRSFGRGQGGDR